MNRFHVMNIGLLPMPWQQVSYTVFVASRRISYDTTTGKLAWFLIAPALSMLSSRRWSQLMPNLLVRGVAEELVRALKERAGAHGRGTEAEHRDILAAALTRPSRCGFAEVLASMPAVGDDADFERPATATDAPRVLD